MTSYLLEAKERMEAIEGIRRGLDSMNQGRGMLADKFFDSFFAKNKIKEER